MAYEGDWIFLRTAIPELRDYILSNDVYRTLRPPERVRIPQLTIGNLMLSQTRLLALSLSDEQQAELAELTRQFDQVRLEWRANWGIKAEREFASRLNLWQQYLRELRGDPRQNAAAFPSEVRHRAILQLLHTELPGDLPIDQEAQLRMLDDILRGQTQAGEFVWEDELASGFPQDQFWFLYLSSRK